MKRLDELKALEEEKRILLKKFLPKEKELFRIRDTLGKEVMAMRSNLIRLTHEINMKVKEIK